MLPGTLCRHRWCAGLVFCIIMLMAPSQKAFSAGDLDIPLLTAPVDYGDVLIDRVSEEKGVVPVVFSHWVHRPIYTCRVCHGELDFSMRANDTGIVCNNGTVKDKYCFVCHNGKTVNGVTAFASRGPEGENCKRCHNADASPNRKKFDAFKNKLPSAKFGNEIDWGKALKDGLIKPKKSLSKEYTPITLDSTFLLQAEMTGIPPAIFSHKMHTEWLDCLNCHPDIFNIKKKTTKHFSMLRILNNEFCGVCHLRIAFPLNDCRRCHPDMKK
jgi:c(7)-type cytochrome triheme protein